MKLKVNPTLLPEYLNRVSYKEHGDRYEREYGNYLIGHFPNSERFWRIFVVPFTERMEGYPATITPEINIRTNIDPEIEDIANTHYSMFLNFAFAHLHLENRTPSSLENIYTHLGTVCDLAETVIEKWHFLFLKLENMESKVLQGLSRDEFLKKAGDLYDEQYQGWYQYYIKKGKSPPISLISRKDTLIEYLGDKSQTRKTYSAHSQFIRQMRNVIVHDVRVARIIEKNGQILIPKPKVITQYRSWRNVAAVIKDQAKIARDFAEQYQQAKNDLETLEQVLNEIWEILIQNIESEFYSKTRSSLRDMFNIEFLSESPIFFSGKSETPSNSSQFPPSSATYTGGTIEYRRLDE